MEELSMLPSIFGENLFDDFFSDPFEMMVPTRNALYGKHGKNLMKTDVRETENSYELDIDLPGFEKKDIEVSLDDGYLTVSARKNESNEEKDKHGNYIRRERYAGSYSRSYYVGEIEEKDISASYNNGTLCITLPKNDQKRLSGKKNIDIN